MDDLLLKRIEVYLVHVLHNILFKEMTALNHHLHTTKMIPLSYLDMMVVQQQQTPL